MARSQPVCKNVPDKWRLDFGPPSSYLDHYPNQTKRACPSALELNLLFPLCSPSQFPALSLCGPHLGSAGSGEMPCPLCPTKAQLPLCDEIPLPSLRVSLKPFEPSPVRFG